jgi:acetyl/propionyl-CoA carboxylase alpha subunit
MNTRLQVEHPVTEQVTGLDLVRAQLLVASGEPLPWRDADLSQRGHAIEARVYAEDPERGFMPQAGRLVELREPRLPGVRVDSGVAEGSEVSVYYDAMIAKVIATAETRDLAIGRLAAALQAFHIAGITTNVPFLQRILALDEFRAGQIDTGFLDRSLATILAAPAQAPAPRPKSPAPRPQPSATPQSAIHNPQWDPWDGVAAAKPSQSAAPSTAKKRRGSLPTGALTAPMPATVVKVHVKPGDAVKKGDVVVLLEAMKMELPIRAAADATVAAVHCREGELVQPDALLVELK